MLLRAPIGYQRCKRERYMRTLLDGGFLGSVVGIMALGWFGRECRCVGRRLHT
jgi:hypothetical protein